MIVLAFYADSAKSTAALKLLEAAPIVKYHEKCLFLRIPFTKTSEQAKTSSARSAPTIFAVNPFKEPATAASTCRSGRPTARTPSRWWRS